MKSLGDDICRRLESVDELDPHDGDDLTQSDVELVSGFENLRVEEIITQSAMAVLSSVSTFTLPLSTHRQRLEPWQYFLKKKNRRLFWFLN